MPSWAPEGGFALALVRACAVAALLSAFGSLVFRAVVLPKVPGAVGLEPAVRRLARRSLMAAALLLPAWAAVQVASFAPAGSGWRGWAAAWPTVLSVTVFGHVWLAQMGAVLAAAWLLARRSGAAHGLALAASDAAVLLQAGHSHALSMYGGPSLLLGSDLVHLASAGAWLGGLLPLLLVVRDAPPRAGALAARWFSPLGKWCVAGMVLSAGFQFWALIGGLPGLIGTAYGWVALAKLGLLGILLLFALANRYRLAPALLHAAPEVARRRLVACVAVQAGFGLATVAAAGILSNLPPALHEQPLWPFAWRPALTVLQDPDLAQEVWTGLGLVAAACGLLAGLAWSRLRRSAGLVALPAAALVLLWLAAPHLSLLLVEAYPTSYYTSPTGFAATAIVQGAALFQPNCARCHGPGGAGDGPDAARLPVPPADLTAPHLWEHADGEMFWWLTHGMEAPDGSPAMPGFAGVLTPAQRWALIDAVRAANAGTALRQAGAWPAPVPLPAFDIVCPGAIHTTPEELRGQVLYVVAGPASAPPGPGVTTVHLTRGTLGPGCASTDPAAWDAVALLTGRTPDTLAGTRLLVDANGWLRTVQPPADAPAWDDPATLQAAIAAVRARPLALAGGGHHHH